MIALYQSGKTLPEIAADLGVTRGAVADKLTYLRDEIGTARLPYRLPREWTEKEIRTVAAMVEQGRTKAEIADAIGRTHGGVKMIMTKYGITSPGFRHWTDEDREKLRQMRAQGKTMAECAWRLGRSLRAVKWQCAYKIGKEA